ncbi:LAME_0E11430g1_1 [Lachancea meyersii CBS 8951]|uniref:LAME_0E11430g1_1 n=1 Tax=Lachancea meyersii CBS 8951 TaxID=1266667 RepID=A0A1G4JKX1_9SACH|nr:LAME_0E11430g1_1 [Lachancea meyersii CBS 8951]
MSFNIFDQYEKTEDHDLRYMALREYFLGIDSPGNDRLLLKLVSRVLIPALSDRDRAVSELVSTQIFPHIAQINPVGIEHCFVLPLCHKLFESVAHLHCSPQVLQALKNVLSRTNCALQTSKPLEVYCETLFATSDRTYIVWETLALLLKRTPTALSNHVIQDTYPKLYHLALSDEGPAAMAAVRAATAKISPSVLTATLEQNHELSETHLGLLSHISCEYSAFRSLYPELIAMLLVMPFTDNTCQTLVNLSVWLQQPAMDVKSAVKEELSTKLFAKCHSVLLEYAETMETVSDEEVDPDQDAYLKELSPDGDGEDPVFEEEDGGGKEGSHDLPDAVRCCLEMLKQVKLPIPQNFTAILSLPRFENGLVSKLMEEGRFDDDCALTQRGSVAFESSAGELGKSSPALPHENHMETTPGFLTSQANLTLTDAGNFMNKSPQLTKTDQTALIGLLYENLSSESDDLATLEMAVDVAAVLSGREEMQKAHDLIAHLLWPHLKPNKSFIRTIKVGNMKQAIDDGVSFRLNCYTLLQRLQLCYQSRCKTLEECVEKGFKDETAIKEVSAALFTTIFEQSFSDIQTRDAHWFREKLCPRVQDRLNKMLATKPNEASTSQQISQWTRSVTSLQYARALLVTAMQTSPTFQGDQKCVSD